MTGRCTRAEAYKIIQDAGGFTNVKPDGIARLRTLSDDDLTSFSQSLDMFAIVESNRRLSLALQREAKRTTLLNAGLFVLTALLLWIAYRSLPASLKAVEVTRQGALRLQPEAAATRPPNVPHAISVDEFMESYGPEDKPIAIAPPCNGNRAECDPRDRMWKYFPGQLEAGAIITPNGLIYRGKKK